MLSILGSEYTISNLLMICLQLIIPLIIYLISYNYVSDEQQNWIENLNILTNIKILFGNKGMFLGGVTFFFTGLASLIILDYYYHKSSGGNERPDLKLFFKDIYNKKESCNVWHFYLFPIMILLSTLGFPIAYQTQSFITHLIMIFIALIINIYLMIFYFKEISYIISFFLLPLFTWQVLNIITFILGTE